ncbi:EboA domain-containing protein [Arenibacter sp. BSSL-BM3]|uniref:EboA domain-containing protein n=1 Tax=Arenibacter arenosicollis TaxID=2762274 RepID=A0ABR7QNF3_9FLAO|nr:EboA domain-containing protein [Arenibacter arenosicollis]MBC8768723.1 EboA domain-containing protein [Arenibacter arenosicollis]
MLFENIGSQLLKILEDNVDKENKQWLLSKIESIVETESTKDLYLTYSLVPTKIKTEKDFSLLLDDKKLKAYLEIQQANLQQIARIFLLYKVLEAKEEFFKAKVANIIEVADKSELETFLKFLVLLPNPENYKYQAVEALRTNIATVFDAIALNNPYPALYFNEQQWNQMYLKAAFMQQNLNDIVQVDKRANKELTRIISDYAHERWAASREIDPCFWRPVGNFMDEKLLKDMKRLFSSDNLAERKAASLCCHNSNFKEAKALLVEFPDLLKGIENGSITWENIKV